MITMDFTLNEEQQLLKDSAEKFVQQDYDFDKRHGILDSPTGFDQAVWEQMAELGWLGLPFDEEDGGFGGSSVETMILMEAVGKGLLVEPYMNSSWRWIDRPAGNGGSKRGNSPRVDRRQLETRLCLCRAPGAV